MKPASPSDLVHPGWHELARRVAERRLVSRRALLPAAALLAGGMTMGFPFGAGRFGLGGRAAAAGLPDLANWPTATPIKHVVILCQENRSFDHYFGAFASIFGHPGDRAVGFNPTQLTYYNAAGTAYHPYHLSQYCDADPDHGWAGSHAKWDGGRMDGWITAESEQTIAIRYYLQPDHIYHVQLAQAFALGDHYFCSEIGPTLPNRLYLWSGTSGWQYLTPTSIADSLPYNNPSLTAPPPVLSWPTMADVLDAAGLPWKCYSVADGSVPSAIGAFNPLIFFSQILENPAKLARATADISEFFADLAAGTLPAVSWIVTEAVVSEHPPAPPDMGQLLAARIVEELMGSSAWESTAFFLVYDEAGGYFEHVPPKILEYVPAGLPDAGDAVGPAFRVPLILVSPWVTPGSVFKGTVDHTSILQFIERNYSTAANPVHLPTISGGRRQLDDLREAFNFRQTPISPPLPNAAQLFASANQTVLTLNADGTVAGCSTTLPSWLPPLLGV